MKKGIRIIGLLVLGLLAAFLIFAAFAPRDYHVERTITINSSHKQVFEQIVNLKNYVVWAPWNAYDSTMTKNFEGNDGEVGATYLWEGNEQVGKGSQEITSIEKDKVSYRITFLEPYESVGNSYFATSGEDGTINVTWGFDGSNSFPWNALMVFMNMDEMLGSDFMKGLENLKSICENQASANRTYRGYTIEEVQYPATTFLAVKDSISWTQLATFYGNSFSKIIPAIQQNEAQIVGAPCGLFYLWNELAQTTNMAAAVPIDKDINVDGLDLIKLEPSKALKIEYHGAYEGFAKAYYAMDDYLKEHQVEQMPPVIEEYITDPQTESDTSKWITNIYYLVK